MRIAILGATSQIARDLILTCAAQSDHKLTLFSRRPEDVSHWLTHENLLGRYAVFDFSVFSPNQYFDAIVNFVGSGSPMKTMAMGSSIVDVTMKYDELAVGYLRHHPSCRYLFLSSGAVYGSTFDEPVDENTRAAMVINNLQPQDWYAVAKLQVEYRHRILPHLAIVDIRVFNYFSHTMLLSSRFLITDILQAIKSGETLITSPSNIVRDYIGPDEFFQLISLILAAPPTNDAVDCYTKAPVDKITLLEAMKERFRLVYEVRESPAGVNATGLKINYFSKNYRANRFGYLPARTALGVAVMESMQIFDA